MALTGKGMENDAAMMVPCVRYGNITTSINLPVVWLMYFVTLCPAMRVAMSP